MKTILTGSIAFDYLMRFPGRFKEAILPEYLDKISLSFLVDEMVKQYGGVGPNIAYTMALLGGNAYLYSAAGRDFNEYGQRLAEFGVDTSGVKVIQDKFTASFFANTDLDNAQVSSFYTGAMLDSADMPLAEAAYQAEDFVMVSPTDPRAMERYIQEAADLKLRMLFDPGQQVVRMSKDALEKGIRSCFGLFVNAYEFELVQKTTGMSEQEILSYPAFSVITLGREGARVHAEGQDFIVPIIEEAAVVDPTGVGDAFRGGFLVGYTKGKNLKLCAEMGTTAAAYCISKSGTQNHTFTIDEFIAYFRENFEDHGQLDDLKG